MPKSIVTAPDGKEYEVTHPEGATQEEIIAFAQDQAKPKRPPVSQRGHLPESPPFMARLGRGAEDVIDRLAQLTVAAGEKIGKYPKGFGDVLAGHLNEERDIYDLGRTGKGFDIARMGGSAGMLSPLMLVPGGQGILGRAKMGALTGAAAGAMQYDPSNSLEGSVKNTAIGAGTGAVLSPVIGAATDKLGEGIRWLTGRIRGALAGKGAGRIAAEVPDLASLPEQAQRDLIAEAQAQIAKTGTLDAEQIARKANLIANGVTPTKSMVTRSPSDWTLERNLQKLSQSPDDQLSAVGQKLTDVYQANDKGLTATLQKIQQQLPKGSSETQGMTVMQSLDDLSRVSQKEVSKLYNQVRETVGDELASDARSLFSVIDDLKDSPAADQITQAATRRLTRLGMLDSQGNLTTKTLTVKEAEGLRQFINQQPNAFGKSQIIKAIDADVLSGAGKDVFGGARQAASARFDMLDNPTVQKALGTYGELAQGKTAQNFIQSQVVNAPLQDVRSLIATISKGEAPEQALGAMRSGLMQHLESKAINPNSGQFSGANLNKELTRIGSDKLNTVLGKEMADRVKSLARAGLDATYQPAYSAVNNSNTAPMLMSLLEKGRAITGVNLPLGLNDTAVKIAARSGYNSQLSSALAAKPVGQLPPLSPIADEVIGVAQQSASPISVLLLDQLRKQADERRKKNEAKSR